MTTEPAYEGWAILEIMGHRVRPGYVREVEMAGGKMIRIDIPVGADHVTEFYGAASIAISLKRIADALDVLKSKQERVDLPTPPETVTGRDGMPLADIRALK